MNREPPRRIDQIEEGAFALRLVRKGPEVAAAIRRSATTGLWKAEINGRVYTAHADPHYAPEVCRIWENGRRISWLEYGVLIVQPPAAPNLPINLGLQKAVF